jgi:AbrB family looped-hinge helix DNA binding protein
MEVGYVTTKGQLVIPSKLRRKFGIKPGTRVNFFEEADGIKIKPVTSEIIKANIGFLGKDGPNLLKALMEEKKIEREL